MLSTSCFKADKFTELFEDSKQRMERKNILLVSKDCTFQPNSNLDRRRKAWSKAKIREAFTEKQGNLKRDNLQAPRTEDTTEKAPSLSAAAKPTQVSKPLPKSRAPVNDENVDPSTGQ